MSQALKRQGCAALVALTLFGVALPQAQAAGALSNRVKQIASAPGRMLGQAGEWASSQGRAVAERAWAGFERRQPKMAASLGGARTLFFGWGAFLWGMVAVDAFAKDNWIKFGVSCVGTGLCVAGALRGQGGGSSGGGSGGGQ